MFGYVIADLARLDEAQRTRYKSVYCGLCRALFHSYGPVPALARARRAACATRHKRKVGRRQN